MSTTLPIGPIITFKAGMCDVDLAQTPPKITARPDSGYLYLFEEDDLMHFCWRRRSDSMHSPEVELVMVPADGRFLPYKDAEKSTESSIKSPTNGRIFVLKFQSSTQRHFFWLQAKSQHPQGDPSWFSPRDLKLGDIVDRLLQGEVLNARDEFATLQHEDGGNQGGDTEMADADHEGPRDTQGGPASGDGPTGGQSGSTLPHQGGGSTDQSAAIPTDDATTAVQNFLRSMQGNQALQSNQGQAQGQIFTTLPDLLPPQTTIPFIDSASVHTIDRLLSQIPPILLLLGQQAANETSSAEPNPETVKAAMDAMSLEQKKELLHKVLRSPQFTQSLNSLTTALRDGGLSSISDALKVPVENGGMIRGGNVPLGGGDAVESFVKGCKKAAQDDRISEEGKMDSD